MIAVPIALLALVAAQQRPDSSATLRVRVMHDGLAVRAADVRSGSTAARTDGAGMASLQLPAGEHAIVVTRLGFVPDTTTLAVRAAQDTSVVITIERGATEIERVVVSATRSERVVEDTPLRVEVIDEEEVAEKTIMTPGDIAMMLNETSGLRVATTAPGLGGANVRVQGMRGRYTLVLTDGLPLAGTQGSFGLLQIPPVDLGRVEVIKGTASALYGPAAMGGVINLVSRRPTDTLRQELLINQTSRGGSDVAYFAGGRFGPGSPLGATLLASAHRQPARDFDNDRWADLVEYSRTVVRPRLFLDRGRGHVFATGGFMNEDRWGGTMPGGVAPDGQPHVERLDTRRADAGIVGRFTLSERGLLNLRASATQTRHHHSYGAPREHDTHGTWFTELSGTFPLQPLTLVAGFAWQGDTYDNRDVPRFDYDWRVGSMFGQTDLDARRWLSLSVSGRVDHNDAYDGIVASASGGDAPSGTSISGRGSVLFRGGDLSARFSGGTGVSMPTVLIEEVEAVGLRNVSAAVPLQREYIESGSLDLMGTFGAFQLNATAYVSRLHDAVMTQRETLTNGLRVLNAPEASTTRGAEGLLRWIVSQPLRITVAYTYQDATEWDPETGGRRDVPLTPRQTASVDLNYDAEGVLRLGVGGFCIGHQSLDDNPYRARSVSYCVFGFLAERHYPTRFGSIRAFVNTENLGDVRQTRWDRLVRPSPGPGGRWTTDAWTDLAGRMINGGVRLVF